MPNEIRNTLLKIPIPDLMREAGAYMDELHQRISELEELNERRLIDVRLKDKRISELEAKLDRVQCAADELAEALADD